MSGSSLKAGFEGEASSSIYRQITAQFLSVQSLLEGRPNMEALLTFPVASALATPAPVQEKPDLMGRFGRTVDAASALNGLTAVQSELSLQPADPDTTSAVVERHQFGSGPEAEPDAGADNPRFLGSGRASWYEHPGRTAGGEKYDPDDLTAAHHSLPFGTRIKVVNQQNHKSVVVRITDRTNEHTKAKRDYAIDLSRESARELGIDGLGMVDLYQVD